MPGQEERVALFRAVLPAELESINRLERFTNPPLFTVKYFALTLDGARRYAAITDGAFGNGPFVIVPSGVSRSLLTWEEGAMLDRSIESVAIPTGLLRGLLPPVVVEVR